MENTIKQIIVVRTKYPDNSGGFRKLRNGKLISQAAHASMAFLTNKLKRPEGWRHTRDANLSEEECLWIDGIFTKICVYVESEEELLEIYNKAKEENLTAHLITDKGLTEFNNVPTHTALAIGPHFSFKFDKITGHLPLY